MSMWVKAPLFLWSSNLDWLTLFFLNLSRNVNFIFDELIDEKTSHDLILNFIEKLSISLIEKERAS